MALVRQRSCSGPKVSRGLAGGCLYDGSFGLLSCDHSALALDRFMNAVVSRRSGTKRTGIMKSALLWSCVR